jgi:hypothetical protein
MDMPMPNCPRLDKQQVNRRAPPKLSPLHSCPSLPSHQCRTRDGRVVRCVATVGTHITPTVTGSFNVLRILPCMSRDFAVPLTAQGRAI